MILVDTTPLVALCDPRDSLNASALRDLQRLSRRPLVVCEPVLTEACLHLTYAAQRQRLRDFLDAFAVVGYAPEDQLGLRAEAFAWLEKYSEHEPDWADAYLVCVSARERRWKVWSYDREFRTIWRRADGTRVPLATRGGK